MSGFEGFANKEESTGTKLFHPKHGVVAVSTNTQLPPGAKQTPDHNKRTASVTKRSYLKKVGD